MDKKPGLAILIAEKGKGKMGKKEEDGGEDKFKEMGQEIASLVKDSPEKVGMALKHFIKVCLAEQDYEE